MSLTELSYWFRKALPYIFLGILGILIIFYSFKLYFIYLESNKPVVVNTNLIFGKIDKPKIQVATTSAGLSFTLDNIEGQPVTATDTASIFYLPQIPTRFGYKEKILLMAKNFGFDTDTNYKLINRLATFSSGNQKLTVDIGNFNFNFESDIDPNLIASSSVTLSETEIKNRAINLLNTIGRYPDELAKGNSNITYLKYDPYLKDFINAKGQSDAQAVEIDFFRSDIEGISVVTPKFFTSQDYLILFFDKDQQEKVIRGQVSFFEKAEDQVGIYPVKTGDQAWEELVNGKGIVVAGQTGIKKITIKDMKLHYLDPDVYQRFLQPVYVFIGENDFVAYVTAVKEEYLQ